MKKVLNNILKALFVGVAFYFIGKALLENWDAIKGYSWQIDPAYLALSFALQLTEFVMCTFGWHMILRMLNVNVPFIETARIWILAQFGKYLPGGVWQFVGRIALLHEKGVSKKRVLLSIHLESTALILSGALSALIAMNMSADWFEAFNLSLVIPAAIGCVILIHPKILETLLNAFFTIIKKDKVKVEFSFPKMLMIICYYILSWSILSLAFFFLIRALYPISFNAFPTIYFAFTASWLIGFLTIFAPGGIGVREGLLIVFLGAALPEFLKPVISVASRIWLIIGEALCAAIIVTIWKLIKKKESSL